MSVVACGDTARIALSPALKWLAVFILGLLSLAECRAETQVKAYFRGGEVKLSIPTDYCPLSEEVGADQRLLRFMEKVNEPAGQLLLAFADCKQLSIWRGGNALPPDDLGYVVGLRESPDVTDQEALNAGLRELYGKNQIRLEALIKDAKNKANSALAQQKNSGTVGSSKQLGVVHDEDGRVYVGFLHDIVDSRGQAKVVVTVSTTFLAEDKSISYYVGTLLRDEKDIERLIQVIKENTKNSFMNTK